MDAETAQLVAVLRQHVKSQIRAQRTLLSLLTQLDERLTPTAEEAQGNGNGKIEVTHKHPSFV